MLTVRAWRCIHTAQAKKYRRGRRKGNAVTNAEIWRQRIRLAGGTSAQMELNAANLLVRYQSRLFSDTVWKKPESVVWTNMVMPTELLYAAGCIPVHIELMSGWMSTLGLAAGQIAHAHAAGFPVGVCSYHKAVIGALELSLIHI